MTYHYMTRNKICNMRIKKLKARLAKALKRQKDQDKLRILAEASLAHQISWWWCHMPKFGKFCWFFCIFQHRKLAQKHSATITTLFPGASDGGNFYIFGFIMMRASIPKNFISFGEKLVHQKVQKLSKNDLSASFWTHRSCLSRFHFWGGKWPPNEKIKVVLETILEDLSNEPYWNKFG